METGVIIRVTEEKQLNLPPEIQSQLKPGDEYRVPSFPACISEGETIEEALENIHEAIELYLEPLEEECN